MLESAGLELIKSTKPANHPTVRALQFFATGRPNGYPFVAAQVALHIAGGPLIAFGLRRPFVQHFSHPAKCDLRSVNGGKKFAQERYGYFRHVIFLFHHLPKRPRWRG